MCARFQRKQTKISSCGLILFLSLSEPESDYLILPHICGFVWESDKAETTQNLHLLKISKFAALVNR